LYASLTLFYIMYSENLPEFQCKKNKPAKASLFIILLDMDFLFVCYYKLI
jgi:hypothetical protein